MKIFCIDRKVDRWPDTAREALESADAVPLDCLPVRLIADSALNRNRLPVFIPDFAREGWSAEVLPAVRIGRLGKFISARFARRYIAGVGVGLLLRQDDAAAAADGMPDGTAESRQAQTSLRWIFDGVLTQGEWYAPMEDFFDRPLSIKSEYSPLMRGVSMEMSPMEAEIMIPWEQLHIEETIALMSRFCTLKSGDIILPASCGMSFPVRLDTALKVMFAGNHEALVTRLK